MNEVKDAGLYPTGMSGRIEMRTPDEVSAMLALKSCGWGTKRIAAELGCSPNTVKRWIAEGGWRGMAPVTRRKSLDGLEDWIVERFRQHGGNADVVRQELAAEKDVVVSLRTVERAVAHRGILWRDTAIRGHRIRGTGILNNELYIGRLVWNRLRYIKDPETGRRVSRLNPKEEWITTEVPELRIIDETLWDEVKHRQGEIDADPRVQSIKATRFWEQRRQTHLLTGLLRCGCCGGGFAAVGRDYLACSAARKLGTCTQKRSYRRAELESLVLDLLRRRLMQPEAVAAFITAYGEEINAGRASQAADRARLEAEQATVMRRLDGLYDAIADGLRTPGLKEKLTSLEDRRAELDAALSAPAPSPVRLHPNLSEIYRRKVMALAETLADPEIRTTALDTIRGLINAITVHERSDGTTVELEGAITAMIELAQPEAGKSLDVCSVKVVAGAGFEPAAFRL
ncbi:MAG: serine recombinase [Albidovulum sp.]|uniref:recombinase zinc beta ribbon domain-containing protein n=1 Tax=Albidovulum sp. TaxID=1872424 RepID=UPI00132AD860|nr:recombinase zinc beta ribbon domain-containing protein [Defluviimonas sp.]KAB2883316.1 MAG: serine recombinase [Defluviimonas sp.]